MAIAIMRRLDDFKNIKHLVYKLILNIMNKNRRGSSSSYLNLHHNEPLSVSKLCKASYFLSYKMYIKAVNKKRNTQKLAKSVVERQKGYERKLWQKNKLNYCDADNDVITVTDIDEDYFKCVHGRPLREYSPAFKSEKMFLNQRLIMKYDEGIKKDCILNIETDHLNEIKSYNKSLALLVEQAKYFDSYVQQDYRKSIKLLEECEKITVKVQDETKKLQQYSVDLFNIKSKLIGLDYKYNIQQKYGRFLYYLSPQTWRMKNREFARSMEIEAKGFDLGRLSEDDTFEDIFEKLQSVCSDTPIKPALYFQNACDIIEVFDTMEKQQLYYFAHVSHVQPRGKVLKDTIKVLKNAILQDHALISQLINSFKNLLHFTEISCAQMERKFYNILYRQFYKSTGTMSVLRMRVNLEFVFEKVFLDQPTNMSIIAMTKELEKYYLDYSKLLDAFHSHSARSAMVKYVESEKNKLKKAEIATTELRLFHRLERRLLRAHGFFSKEASEYTALPSPIVTNKSKRKCTKKQKKSLSVAELEYLTFFTDWCQSDSWEDTEKYLHGINFETV